MRERQYLLQKSHRSACGVESDGITARLCAVHSHQFISSPDNAARYRTF